MSLNAEIIYRLEQSLDAGHSGDGRLIVWASIDGTNKRVNYKASMLPAGEKPSAADETLPGGQTPAFDVAALLDQLSSSVGQIIKAQLLEGFAKKGLALVSTGLRDGAPVQDAAKNSPTAKKMKS